MRIGIQTWGTEGDIRPFIALAVGLKSRGHEVTLSIASIDNRCYDPFLERYDLRASYAGKGVFSHNTGEYIKKFFRILETKGSLKQLKLILDDFFNPLAEKIYASSKKLCMENDILVGHFLLHPLNLAAEMSNRPFVSVSLCHTNVPSRHITPMGAPYLGTWMNILWWKLGEIIIDIYFKRDINRLRAKEGAPDVKKVLGGAWESGLLNLVAVSKCFCPQPLDWKYHHRVCGFFNMPDRMQKPEMPRELGSFLNSGPAPVYMTFGSMMPDLPCLDFNRETALLMIEAARIAECRAVIQAPWEKIEGVPEYRDIYRVTNVSHNEIFPHCSAVVHHGGAGTTQAATISGCPSIVVAHAADQEFWGRELNRLGICRRTLRRRSLTPENLAKEIRAVIGSPAMAEKAKIIGDTMKKEDGVGLAAEYIEGLENRN